MTTRREFIHCAAAAAAAASVPAGTLAVHHGGLPKRPIPGTDDALPIVGLGNSNAFRRGDMAASRRIIAGLLNHGGAYVDCSGSSRFVVADVADDLGAGDDLFLGSYFAGADEAASREEAKRLKAITGKDKLDLMHSYVEDAVPNWDTFRRWKDEGLTRYIGAARHRSRYYDDMTALMQTGTVDVLQVNYSLVETEAEKRVLPMARDQGVAVTINRPFINGRYFRIVKGHELPGWAAEFDCDSWAQFSLKFILSHPVVNCVLTETANPRHVLENIGAGFGRLPDRAMRRRMLEHMRSLL